MEVSDDEEASSASDSILSWLEGATSKLSGRGTALVPQKDVSIIRLLGEGDRIARRIGSGVEVALLSRLFGLGLTGRDRGSVEYFTACWGT